MTTSSEQLQHTFIQSFFNGKGKVKSPVEEDLTVLYNYMRNMGFDKDSLSNHVGMGSNNEISNSVGGMIQSGLGLDPNVASSNGLLRPDAFKNAYGGMTPVHHKGNHSGYNQFVIEQLKILQTNHFDSNGKVIPSSGLDEEIFKLHAFLNDVSGGLAEVDSSGKVTSFVGVMNGDMDTSGKSQQLTDFFVQWNDAVDSNSSFAPEVTSGDYRNNFEFSTSRPSFSFDASKKGNLNAAKYQALDILDGYKQNGSNSGLTLSPEMIEHLKSEINGIKTSIGIRQLKEAAAILANIESGGASGLNFAEELVRSEAVDKTILDSALKLALEKGDINTVNKIISAIEGFNGGNPTDYTTAVKNKLPTNGVWDDAARTAVLTDPDVVKDLGKALDGSKLSKILSIAPGAVNPLIVSAGFIVTASQVQAAHGEGDHEGAKQIWRDYFQTVSSDMIIDTVVMASSVAAVALLGGGAVVAGIVGAVLTGGYVALEFLAPDVMSDARHEIGEVYFWVKDSPWVSSMVNLFGMGVVEADPETGCLNGTDGNDILNGISSTALVDGNSGDDRFMVSADTDVDFIKFNGGEGQDEINFSLLDELNSEEAYSIEVSRGEILFSNGIHVFNSSVEILTTTNSADHIVGTWGDQNSVLKTIGGNDHINVDVGYVKSGDGDDVIIVSDDFLSLRDIDGNSGQDTISFDFKNPQSVLSFDVENRSFHWLNLFGSVPQHVNVVFDDIETFVFNNELTFSLNDTILTSKLDFSQSESAIGLDFGVLHKVLGNDFGEGYGVVFSNVGHVYGTAFDDVFRNSILDANIYGGQGDDTLFVDDSNVGFAFFGDSGEDIVDFSKLSSAVDVLFIPDYVFSTNDVFDIEISDSERFIGTDFNDSFEMTSDSFEGITFIDAGFGTDVLDFSSLSSDVHYSNGVMNFPEQETVSILGFEELFLGSGFDIVNISEDDTIYNIFGGLGNDSITGSELNQFIDGGHGSDHLSGSGGADIIVGGGGDDNLFGGEGVDKFFGGSGNNFIDGGSSQSLLPSGESQEDSDEVSYASSEHVDLYFEVIFDSGQAAVFYEAGYFTSYTDTLINIETIVLGDLSDRVVFGDADNVSAMSDVWAGGQLLDGPGDVLDMSLSQSDWTVSMQDYITVSDGNDSKSFFEFENLLFGMGDDHLTLNSGYILNNFELGEGSDFVEVNSAVNGLLLSGGSDEDGEADIDVVSFKDGEFRTFYLNDELSQRGVTADNKFVFFENVERIEIEGVEFGFGDSEFGEMTVDFSQFTGRLHWTDQGEVSVITNDGTGDVVSDVKTKIVGAEVLIGTANDDNILGMEGQIIDGGEGDDHINIYKADEVTLGEGFDTIRWHFGYADDRVSTERQVVKDFTVDDTLTLADMSAFDVSFEQTEEGVLFTHTSGRQLLLEGYEFQGDYSQIVFEDGSFFGGGLEDDVQDFSATTGGNGIVVNAGGGNDLISGFLDAINWLWGGWGSDILTGGGASDKIEGEDGDDIITGGGGDDMLYGGSGNDTFVITDTLGEAQIYGGDAGTSSMVSGTSMRAAVLAANSDGTLSGDKDILDISALATINLDTNRVSTSLGGVTYEGIEGFDAQGITFDVYDTMVDDESKTIVDFSNFDGRVLLRETGVIETIVKNGYSDWSYSGSKATIVGADVVLGSAGADNFQGVEGQTLDLGAGNDYVNLYAADEVTLGTGADLLQLYLPRSNIRVSDAPQVITDFSLEDTLIFNGFSAFNVTFENTVDGALFTDTSGAQFLFEGISGEDVLTRAIYKDGSMWIGTTMNDLRDITNWGSGQVMYGLEGNDRLIGSNNATDRIYGGEGNDAIYGKGGRDYLYGDEGDDYIDGGGGGDRMYGGAGNDRIRITEGATGQIAYGGGGSDFYWGNRNFVWSTAWNTFYGGAGRDVFYIPDVNTSNWYGGERQPHQRFADFDVGEDLIVMTKDDTRFSTNSFYRYGQTVAQLGNDVRIGTNDNRLILNTTVTDVRDALRWVHYNDDYNQAIALWQDVAVDGFVDYDGNSGNNNFVGNSGADRMNGAGGNDTLTGNGGDDEIHTGSGNDLVYGGDGNDAIHALGGQNVVYGGNGNDWMDARTFDGTDKLTGYGGDGEDTIYGSTGSDLIYGGNDNDIVEASVGQDTIYGGAGDDNINGQGSDDLIYGDDGNDTLIGGSENDTLYGGAGDDHLDGEFENDDLYGGDGSDYLMGGSGDDTLSGDLGDDTLEGGTGADVFVTRADGSVDTIVDFSLDVDQLHIVVEGFASGTTLADVVSLWTTEVNGDTVITYENGGSVVLSGVVGLTQSHLVFFTDNDTLTGTELDDELFGEQGQDELYGLGGYDRLYGGTGEDMLYGGDDTDELYGGTGADALFGGLGSDMMSGDDGDDVLDGGAGDDILSGGFGNDIFHVGAGFDTIDGGAGDDTVILQDGFGSDMFMDYDITDEVNGDLIDSSNLNEGVSVMMMGTGNGRLVTLLNYDMLDFMGVFQVVGTDHVDDFDASMDMAGVMFDTRGGDDFLMGGLGDDTLKGGLGNDMLMGDAGSDVFVFEPSVSNDVDVIVDFTQGEDLLHISSDAFAAGTTKQDVISNGFASSDGVSTDLFLESGGVIRLENVAVLTVDDFELV